MNQKTRESKTSRNFEDDWRNDIMKRDKDEIVFMLKIVGKENKRLRNEIGELEKTNFHLLELIEKLEAERSEH